VAARNERIASLELQYETNNQENEEIQCVLQHKDNLIQSLATQLEA